MGQFIHVDDEKAASWPPVAALGKEQTMIATLSSLPDTAACANQAAFRDAPERQ